MKYGIVQVEKKVVYGRKLIYPFNDLAKKLVALTGRKTFFPEDIKLIEQIGFEVKSVAPDIFD